MPTNRNDMVDFLGKTLLAISNPQCPSIVGDDERVNLLLTLYNAILNHSDINGNFTIIDVQKSIETGIILLEERIQEACYCPFIKTAMAYFISELVCNIEQHAEVEQGFGLVHYDQANNKLLIGIADGGISIYGSYIRTQKYLSEVGDSDAQALYLAQNGYSTKNLPNAENRGYGISSNSRMIVEGLGGEFAILSGNALFHHSADSKRIFALPEDVVWPGTLVLAEIPVEKKEFNLYNYIG